MQEFKNIKLTASKKGMTAKTFFGSILPIMLLTVCLAIAGLNQMGVIDLKQVGAKIKDTFAPAKESNYLMEAPQLPRLEDGTVGEPYWIKIDPEWEDKEKDPEAVFKFTLDNLEDEALPPGLELSSEGVISGMPTKEGKYTFGACIEEQKKDWWRCYEGHITIKPKPQPPVALLTGNFTGPFEFTDNVGNPLFRDTGILNLQLEHEGNEVSGVYTFTQIKMEQLQALDQVKFGTTAPDFSKKVSGKVSGAHIDFTDGWIRFSGTFDSEEIDLNIESCSFNTCCVNPEHGEWKGESTPSKTPGVPDVPAPKYTCENGIVGTANLNKIKLPEVTQEQEENKEQEVVKDQPIIVHKGISVLKLPLNCIKYRNDICPLFNCIFEDCKCTDKKVVYDKDITIDTEQKALDLVNEYFKSKKIKYSVDSAMKLNEIFYNVYATNNGNEIIYTVTSNGIIMNTQCGG